MTARDQISLPYSHFTLSVMKLQLQLNRKKKKRAFVLSHTAGGEDCSGYSVLLHHARVGKSTMWRRIVLLNMVGDTYVFTLYVESQ